MLDHYKMIQSFNGNGFHLVMDSIENNYAFLKEGQNWQAPYT